MATSGAAGEWYKTVDLPPAIHQYKFIIDGQWRHDHIAPTVLDNLGNVNNCITVRRRLRDAWTGGRPARRRASSSARAEATDRQAAADRSRQLGLRSRLAPAPTVERSTSRG